MSQNESDINIGSGFINPIEHHFFSIPINHGVPIAASDGGGYTEHDGYLNLYSAPKAIYLDLQSDAMKEPISLALNADRAASLIVTLQQALKEHIGGKQWLDTVDFDALLDHAISSAKGGQNE
ncbi:hypothetical protein [uncultured Amphritea sp.]|uniref:hypothetical protein n=1 Tax=uncultured Amphritea sp. TaxID=981605 RepID=UPI00260BA7EF|nr:hypothetical protein [uncultured Amphritea sp.]